jgi:hypothetical protein
MRRNSWVLLVARGDTDEHSDYQGVRDLHRPKSYRTIDISLLRSKRCLFWYAPIWRISSICMLVHTHHTSTFLCKYVVVQESFKIVQEIRQFDAQEIEG